MDAWRFIFISIFELCCSLGTSILSYWSMVSDTTSLCSLPIEQTWTVALDSFISACWIFYAMYHHPVSWFLVCGNIFQPILHLLCFIAFICHQFRGSELLPTPLRTGIALGTPPFIFIFVSSLWSFDVMSGIWFSIFAILVGISSAILNIIHLWRIPTFANWKIILRSVLGLVAGSVVLFLGIQEQSIPLAINSMAIVIFGLVQLGVALFIHVIFGLIQL